MDGQDRNWENLKRRYLRDVRRALSAVKGARVRAVLDDISGHLDQRLAELEPAQRTPENLNRIVAEMGPASDYAELLAPRAGRVRSRARLRPLLAFGLLACICITGILLPTALSNDEVAHVISFKPVAPFNPQTPRELLKAFNEHHPKGVRTHHFRTTVQDNALVGLICVDTQAESDAIVKMVEASGKLTLLETRAAGEKDFKEHQARGQVSLVADQEAETYIVAFKPVDPFLPRTARELLGAFNEKHPPGVRTHHYRTRIEGDALIGLICVDTKAGRDAVAEMLRTNEKLELIEMEQATGDTLENLQKMGQPSLKKSDRPRPTPVTRSRGPRAREPQTRNKTVKRLGNWPSGNCSIRGGAYRKASRSRVGHGKVSLSSAKHGTWIVEMRDHGDFEFQNIPAGVYTLKTTDTFGYKDSYYDPQNQGGEQPRFQLQEGQRVNAPIHIEPARPYRRITGRIIGADGKPPAACSALQVAAWVKKPQGRWKGHFRWLSSSSVEKDGSYVLDELDGRPVYVQVRDAQPPNEDQPFPPCFYPGTFSRSEASLVTFGDAGSVGDVDIVMKKHGGLAVVGVVTDESTGAAVGEALVTIFHADMFFDLFYAYTDEQGRYRLDELGDGTFIVHVDARHEGYVKSRKLLTIDRKNARTELDFSLRRGVNIRGNLVDERGNPYRAGRSYGYASRKRGGFAAASNFRYGNRHAPDYLRSSSTVFYEEGEGDASGTIMAFPRDSSFLLPAVAAGEIVIGFHPRGRGERVSKILYRGRDIRQAGLVVEAGRDIEDVTIVIQTTGGK